MEQPPQASKAGNTPNRRTHKRVPINARISIYLNHDQRNQRRINGVALDVSKTGILVQTEHPIPSGSLVYLRAETSNLAGKAMVRFCAAKGIGYKIGMYFPDPLISRSLLPKSTS
jgi:hypothetical protein